jgi:hypothetical protein
MQRRAALQGLWIVVIAGLLFKAAILLGFLCGSPLLYVGV